MANVTFEKLSNGYRVRRIESNGKLVTLGIIKRYNIESHSYEPKVDLDGNVTGWYSDYHAKANYIRHFDQAIKEIKQPFMFKAAKGKEGMATSSELQIIKDQLMKLNSYSYRKKEILEFKRYIRETLIDLNSFVGGSEAGKYSPESVDQSLKTQATDPLIIK